MIFSNPRCFVQMILRTSWLKYVPTKTLTYRQALDIARCWHFFATKKFLMKCENALFLEMVL